MAADTLIETIRIFGLGFPESHEDHPWDHIALKVRKKTFVFLGGHRGAEGLFSMTVKLPISADMVVGLPYVERAGYGLGRTGWVTVKASEAALDVAELQDWVTQSYRAVAPKTLVKRLDGLDKT